MCDRQRRKKESGRERGRKEVFPWECELHNQPSEVMETGDLTFPHMLFMALIMDLMLPWRPSIPTRKNTALILKESRDTDVRLNLCETSAKGHLTNSFERATVNRQKRNNIELSSARS